MSALSKETENKLLAAIGTTSDLVNSGMNPNAAIVKAAQDHQIGAGCINLMVHAYNTGRTAKQRQAGTDPFEKAADFDLADAATILEALYPDRVKSAAAVEQETAVSADYGVSPTGLLARKASREKAARAIDWKLCPTPPPLPRDDTVAQRRIVADQQRTIKTAEEDRRKASAAMDKAASTAGELTEYFRRPDCQPIPVVRENVMLLHGGVGERIFDQLIKPHSVSKLAMHRQPRQGSLPPAVGTPYDLVNRLIDELATADTLRTTSEKTAAAAQQQAEVLLGPFFGPARSALGGLPLAEKQAKFGIPDLGVGAAAGYIAGGLKDPSTDASRMQSSLAKLTDPAHESELRKIRAQSTLQDLLLNDEHISGYDPQDALDAYNDIVGMAPRAQDQKLLLQSLMRKRLTQGALDPFEVDQLLGMEGKMRQNTQQPTPMPLSAGVGADGTVL